jgi:tetratricopeptide (TPR) repeat protein
MRRTSMMSTTSLALAGSILLSITATELRAASAVDCFSADTELKIKGCTELLQGNLSPADRADAYAARALGFSIKGWYAEAIQDYDRSLAITDDNPTTLNNRAWAYFRWGKPAEGRNDVEKSLALDNTSGAAFDTRAHIAQSLGQPDPALADYKKAMTFGGPRMTKMYQCGLTDHGLYKGPVDGVSNPELLEALSICVKDTTCDPLPSTEECKPGTS